MNIGFDFDGVLYNWHEVVYEDFVNCRGYTGSFEKFWTNIFSILNKIGQDNLVGDAEFYSRKIIRPDFLQVLLDIKKKGHTIYYITARPKECEFVTRKWVQYSELPFSENLFITHNKRSIVLDKKIDYFIEDRDKNALELKDITDVILVKQVWNEHIRDQFVSVGSVLELPMVIPDLV